MKKGILVVLGLLVLGGAGAGGWYWYQNTQNNVSSDHVAYVAKVSTLNGSSVGTANRYAGVVEPQQTVSVKLESGRNVSEVKVKVGDVVKAGQLLFQYDVSSIQDDLKEKELEYDRLVTEHSSIEEQIASFEKASQKAETSEERLQLTIEIETAKLNLKKNEYNQESKSLEVEKLKEATQNPEVKSEIDGVIQKIDESKMNSDENDSLESGTTDLLDSSSSSDSSAFITILSTGAYRVKGMVNEQNIGDITPESPIIIRSRVDDSQIWKGTMGNVDRDASNSSSSGDNALAMDSGSSNPQTSSSTYPFYVNLESADGLMLGQHVYIENDIGQDRQKSGVWLPEYFIVDADTASPYVWEANADNRLEKREITLGEFDESLAQYEITDGLSENDKIAYPNDALEVGMATQEGDETQVISSISGNASEDDAYDVSDLDEMMSDSDLDIMNEATFIEDMEPLDDVSTTDTTSEEIINDTSSEFSDIDNDMENAIVIEDPVTAE
ncbi:MAG: efflux RND transporter periplasmic adaptor subunit [Eubacteriales bacterium]|nr:efflux RND transporter periplasmic adaptor subunit [Eubacteriales bacterium]